MENQKKIINNSVVIPEYRNFCKDNGLPFHFWNELPKESFDPELAKNERELHKEAMDIFNLTKNPYSYLNKNLIKWRFTDWGGDFEYESEPIEGFLAKKEVGLKTLEKKHRAMTVIGTLFFSALILILLIHYRISLYLTFPAFIASLFLENYIGYFIKSQKRKSDKNIETRLDKLREKILIKQPDE